MAVCVAVLLGAAACGSGGSAGPGTGGDGAVWGGPVPGTWRSGAPDRGVDPPRPATGPVEEGWRTVGTWAPRPPGTRLAQPERRAAPVALRIAEIGVLAPVVSLGLTPGRELAVPESEDVVGWWSGGAVPGRAGPTVIVGHVDSDRRPGVFELLRDLRPGAVVEVLREDGASVRYTVERVEQHPKDAFPTAAVYGPTPASALRLITCGGDFDRSTRHYRDNVIAFARLAAD